MLVDRAGLRGAVLGALVALLVAVPTADGEDFCGRDFHRPPLADAPVLTKPPLFIGDSVGGFAMRAIQREGYRVILRSCGTFPFGINALKREAQKRGIPRIVVFEFGTRGDVTIRNIARVLRFLGPDRKLVLVTPRKWGGGLDPDAADYHRAAERYPEQVFVIPWAEYGQQHPEWFYPDMVHPTVDGQRVLAEFLEAALYV